MGGMRLVRTATGEVWPMSADLYAWVADALALTLVCLAMACLAVGLVRWRQLPAGPDATG